MQPPPPGSGYAAYPRDDGFDDPEKLRALMTAYFRSWWMVLGFFVFGIGVRGLGVLLAVSDAQADLGAVLVMGGLFLMFAANFFIAFQCARMIAEAKGKSSVYVVGTALATSLVSPCFCGLGGVAVIQTIVQSEAKKYGLKGGFLGISKRSFEQRISELEAQTRTRGL
ncbi:MAG: hypothetical protein JST30_16905 [Armatimonadetes bacterium]|nr:hypothetical protein [Armatimonadota bacterium]